jgi:excisionase family DNA binding protein
MENIIEASPLAGFRDLLSVDDLAEIFGVSKQTVYKELREGKFGNPIQIGRAYKVPKIFVVRQFFL